MICDFCKQDKKKIYTDFDRLICNRCLSIYLRSLRYKIVNLSAGIRLLDTEYQKELRKQRLRYESLKGYLNPGKRELPKDLERKKEEAVSKINYE